MTPTLLYFAFGGSSKGSSSRSCLGLRLSNDELSSFAFGGGDDPRATLSRHLLGACFPPVSHSLFHMSSFSKCSRVHTFPQLGQLSGFSGSTESWAGTFLGAEGDFPSKLFFLFALADLRACKGDSFLGDVTGFCSSSVSSSTMDSSTPDDSALASISNNHGVGVGWSVSIFPIPPTLLSMSPSLVQTMSFPPPFPDS